MVLRPCARTPKQPMVLRGPCTWFKTMYGGDVVMFLPNKIITNKKWNYSQTNIGLAHGFKTMCKAL